jgi:DNA-binding MarR family transcriptional regulator
MHSGNVIVAWLLAGHDRLRAAVRELGLDPRELAALTLVGEHDGCSVDWLRGRVELTQSGTVRLVDRLAGRGLLVRGASTGRGVPLHVTAAGEQALGTWRDTRDSVVDELLAGVPEERRAAFVADLAGSLTARPRARSEADATCRTCTWVACGNDCPVDRSVTAAAAPDRADLGVVVGTNGAIDREKATTTPRSRSRGRRS